TKGMYNLHVLDAIQNADKDFGRKVMSLGTFYPTVKRLEADGFIEGFWDDTEIKPGVKRRYLKITGAGIKALVEGRQYLSVLAKNNCQKDNPSVPAPELGFHTLFKGGEV
ncbi:MAG: PadR family transcriptional regulator, partial [Cyanobacteria bacterium J06621_11]